MTRRSLNHIDVTELFNWIRNIATTANCHFVVAKQQQPPICRGCGSIWLIHVQRRSCVRYLHHSHAIAIALPRGCHSDVTEFVMCERRHRTMSSQQVAAELFPAVDAMISAITSDRTASIMA